MVSSDDRKTVISVSAEGTTEFEFDFYILSEDDLSVYYTDPDGVGILLVKETNYSVNDVDSDDFADGGTVVITNPAAGYDDGTITIIGDTEVSQEVDLISGTATPKGTYEDALDKLTMVEQEIKERLSRTLLFPISEIGEESTIPIKSLRANQAFLFDASGDLAVGATTNATVASFIETFMASPDIASALTVLGFSSFVQTMLDDADAAAVLTTLGVTSFMQTLLDDPDAATALATLGFSVFMQNAVGDSDIETFLARITDITAAQQAMGMFNSWGYPRLLDDLSVSAGVRTIAVLTGTTMAAVDTTGETLTTYEFDGSTVSAVGNALTITGAGNLSICRLTDTTVVVHDDLADTIQAYSFDGTDWTTLGNSFDVQAGVYKFRFAQLSSTDVAVLDRAWQELRTYRFDGTDWSQVGNSLAVSSYDPNDITPLDSATIALVSDAFEIHRATFDGTDWAVEVANIQMKTGPGDSRIAAVSPSDVLWIDDVDDELRVVRWDGSAWSEVSQPALISGTIDDVGALTGVNPVIVKANAIEVYQYSVGLSWLEPYRG